MSEAKSTDPIGSREWVAQKREEKRLKARMVTACQRANKAAWRKSGKRLYAYQKKHGFRIKPWMEEYFGGARENAESNGGKTVDSTGSNEGEV